MQSRFIQIKYRSNILIIPKLFICWVLVSASWTVPLGALLPFTIRVCSFCSDGFVHHDVRLSCLSRCLFERLFISLWSTTAKTKNGLLDANKSACLRFLVLRTKTKKMVNRFRLSWCWMFQFISRPLDGATSVWIIVECLQRSAESYFRHSFLFILRWRKRNVLKPEDAGLVHVCLNIITSTFQLLRCPPDGVVVHSRHLGKKHIVRFLDGSDSKQVDEFYSSDSELQSFSEFTRFTFYIRWTHRHQTHRLDLVWL